jgi:hypothetical protein
MIDRSIASSREKSFFLKRETHEEESEGGWEGEEEGNQRICPPPQACSNEEVSGERRGFFVFCKKILSFKSNGPN